MIQQINWPGNEPCYCPVCKKLPRLFLDSRGGRQYAECCGIKTVALLMPSNVLKEWNRIANIYILDKVEAHESDVHATCNNNDIATQEPQECHVRV